MVFSSVIFIFEFLPLFSCCMAFVHSDWKNACLLIGSLIFYFYGAKGHPLYFFLFLFSIVVNFMLGGLIGQSRRNRKKYWHWVLLIIFRG